MKKKERPYRPLPGRAAGVMGVYRLWAAEDHLILVSSMMGSERYQRFFFKDIEAFVIRHTSGCRDRNLVLGLCWIVMGGLAAAAYSAMDTSTASSREGLTAFAIVCGVFSALAFIPFLINSLRGQTCRFYVQTSVGLQQLPCPRRVPIARRVLERLAPAIAASRESAAREKAPESANLPPQA